ncbi:serine/threonine protein kinase [Sedimenticola thiotaurini]|uniref:serine/threonine protein kinase n=1 Tax=Sedimenticola thiotaurini TaxID=1543721 RepID=UPI0009E57022|nr:serine/threonine-protein kinase [Sedimenticola thiotaurini]
MMSDMPEKLGKYQIKSVIGQGAMGVVYQAFDPDIERNVAIKVLHAHHCTGEHGRDLGERFRREAQAAARCIHPNIVAIFELGRYREQDYIVMEYVQGEELKYFLASGHRFSQDEALFITMEVLKALVVAHAQGVVHRDIKPANIILLDSGGVKVTDFGVARLDQSDLTLAGNMVGTPNYMCPEGLRGEVVDQRADIYSTGMVLLEMLTGARITPKELYSVPIHQFIDKVFETERGQLVGDRLQSIIRQALSESIAERFSSAQVFLDSLQALAGDNGAAPDTSARIAQTVVNQKPLRESVSPATGQLVSMDTLHELEHSLTSYVGPIAGILVQKSFSGVSSPDELVQSLATHISDVGEREAFLVRARTVLSQDSTVLNRSAARPLETSELNRTTATDFSSTLDQAATERLARLLAFYVGPLAQHLLKRCLAKSHSYEDLCQRLASNIPTEAERVEFLSKT